MKLNILPLNQRDERWKLKKLGFSDVTIGNYGCVLTCHSMIMNYFGHEMLPDVLNEVYKTKEVFDNFSYINFYKAGAVFPDVKAKEMYDCLDVPCDLSKIDAELNKKQPVIARVDFDTNPSTKEDWHYILIIGKTDDGHYIINDPWTGETYFFDAKYGEPSRFIYGLRIYEGTPKEDTNLEDKVNDLSDKLSSCNTMLAEKTLEANNSRTELEVQEKDNADLASQLTTARSERDSAVWERNQKGILVDKLKGEIKGYKETIKTLESQIKDLKEKSVDGLTKWELLLLFFRKKVN